MKKAVAVSLVILTLLLSGCYLTTGPYDDLALGDVLQARYEDLCEDGADGYVVSVHRTVSRISRDDVTTVTKDYFARRFESDPDAPSAFLHEAYGPDGVTRLSLDFWRTLDGAMIRYEQIGATVYADATDESAEIAQEPHQWNFLPLTPWDDYGVMKPESLSRVQFTVELPIESLIVEEAFAGYAQVYAGELSHLNPDGQSGIVASFNFIDSWWVDPYVIYVDLTFTFDLDSAYDGETKRIISQFRHGFVLEDGSSLLESVVGGMSNPIVASSPEYLLEGTQQALLVSLDASVLSTNYLRYYFAPGIYYATAPAGFPTFTCDIIDEAGNPVACSDGCFTVSAWGFYLFRITPVDGSDLMIRVGPYPSSEYTDNPLPA